MVFKFKFCLSFSNSKFYSLFYPYFFLFLNFPKISFYFPHFSGRMRNPRLKCGVVIGVVRPCRRISGNLFIQILSHWTNLSTGARKFNLFPIGTVIELCMVRLSQWVFGSWSLVLVIPIWSGLIRCDPVWSGLIWSELVWFDMIWSNLADRICIKSSRLRCYHSTSLTDYKSLAGFLICHPSHGTAQWPSRQPTDSQQPNDSRQPKLRSG